MKTKMLLPLLTLVTHATIAAAQSPTPVQQSAQHGPPQQAYVDCKGQKAGDTVQHTTPEGKVPATCVDTPAGLVARPVQMRNAQPSSSRQ